VGGQSFKILFLSQRNSARSMIAEALANSIGHGELKAFSAGVRPASEIDPVVVLRSLLPEHRDLLLASPEQLGARNPHSLPLKIRLDEWHHPDLANSELPSESETFQMLVEAIVTGNTRCYAPTKQPNTDWRNWPDGGTL